MIRYPVHRKHRCSTPFRLDPISRSELDPGCSDTTILLYQIHFININVFVLKSLRKRFVAPIPGSTRLADPNRFRGAKPYIWDSLPVFFFQSLTYTCGYVNNFCNNQKSFTYTKELPPEWYPLKSIHIC